MAYLNDMPKTCRDRGTNPEWPLQLLKALTGAFERSLVTGAYDTRYVGEKMKSLASHIKWLEEHAKREEAERGRSERDGKDA